MNRTTEPKLMYATPTPQTPIIPSITVQNT